MTTGYSNTKRKTTYPAPNDAAAGPRIRRPLGIRGEAAGEDDLTQERRRRRNLEGRVGVV
jgi:hypothetical protein